MLRLLILSSLLGTPQLHAGGSLSNDVLALFPQESGQVGFIDLVELRRSKHYALIEEKTIAGSFATLMRFLGPMGFDFEKQVDTFAWAVLPPDEKGRSNGRQPLFLGVIKGKNFKTDQIKELFTQHNITPKSYGRHSIYAAMNSAHPTALVFLDSETVLMGQPQGLGVLLDTHERQRDSALSNNELLSQIAKVNGSAPVWMVMDKNHARLAVVQSIPGIGEFAEFSSLTEHFLGAQIKIAAYNDIDVELQIFCDDRRINIFWEPAPSLANLITTAIFARKHLEKKGSPLHVLLNNTSAYPAGTIAIIKIHAGDDDAPSLLKALPRLFGGT